MRRFQLDECSDDADFADDCNRDGRCEIRRMPVELKEELDPDVLPDLLARDAPLVTTDHGIVFDNPACIGPKNPGIIVIKARPSRGSLMQKLVARFKSQYPAWAETDWSEVYMEIEETEVYLHRLVDADIYNGPSIQFNDPDFAEKLYTGLLSLFSS
jgi:hypothetical protein